MTHGLRLNEAGTTLVGKRSALVHFHGLRGHEGAADLDLSARGTPSAVHVLRDRAEVASDPRLDSSWLVRVEVPKGQDHVEISLEAEPLAPAPSLRPLFALNDVTLRVGLRWRVFDTLVAVTLALLVAALVAFGESVTWAAIVALVASVVAVWSVAVVEEPVALLAFSDPVQTAWRVAALALLWILVTRRAPTRSVAALAIGATAALLYLPALRYGFLTDDFFFARPLSLRDLAGTFVGSWDPRGAANTHYRPLVAMSLALDYALWGARTAGYHLTNLLLQIIAVWMGWRLLAHLDLPAEAALSGALAWAAHPVSAAAASWANERTDSVMAIFYLGALAVLTRPTFGRRERWAFLLCTAAALASKEMAVSLPLAAAGLCLVRGGTRGRWKAVAGAAVMTAAFVGWWVALFPSKAVSSAVVGAGGATAILSDRGTTLMGILVPEFAPPTYQDWVSASVWTHPIRLLLLAAIVGATAVALRRRSRPARLVALGLVWPLATFVPLLPLRGDRDVYRVGLIMAFGFAIAWAAAWAALEVRSPRLAAVAAGVLALWFGSAAIASSQAWGPGGVAMTSGTRWKIGNESWLASLTPEMRDLFARQNADFAHRTEPWR